MPTIPNGSVTNSSEIRWQRFLDGVACTKAHPLDMLEMEVEFLSSVSFGGVDAPGISLNNLSRYLSRFYNSRNPIASTFFYQNFNLMVPPQCPVSPTVLSPSRI